MKTTVYNDLSNRQETVSVAAGQTVRDAFKGYDTENAVIVVNGKVTDNLYVLRENDVVMIRFLPGATGTMIALAVIAVVGAVVGGVIAGSAAYKAKKAAEESQKELEKMKKLSNKPEIDNRPFLRGASNTLATGNSQPYICGRQFFTPYLLCSPFYEISGEDGKDEYTYTVLECGFNKQAVEKIAVEDVVIKSFSGAEVPQGSFAVDKGFFAEDGLIEISQDGSLFSKLPQLNYKVVSKSCNEEIPKDADVAAGKKEFLTYTLGPCAKSVDVAVSFPYGLYRYNDDNDKISCGVTITPQYSLDGGESWKSFTFNNNGVKTNHFERCISSKELRFTAHTEFSTADYKALKKNGQSSIWLRVRSDGKSGDSSVQNTCYLLFYQTLCFDPNKSSAPAGVLDDGGNAGLVPCFVLEERERKFSAVLGIKLKATKTNEDKLRKINVITNSLARTWDGKKWSDEKTVTRNPAAVALEIETSHTHAASRYGDSELDLESFGEWYEYCEKNDFKFDHVITQNAKKDDTLKLILDSTFAVMYTDIYGRRAVAIDTRQENAIAVYNPQNIISIQNKKTFGRRADGIRIKYNSSENDLFQEDTYLVMREENGVPVPLTADSIIKDITVTGVTTFAHIVKYARRLMASESLRPKSTVIEVGNEGIFFTPYSKVLIQDDSLKIGTGHGTVKSVSFENNVLRSITLNGTVVFEAGKKYGVIVNCFSVFQNKAVPRALKVSGEGETDFLAVETSVLADDEIKPCAGDVLSFGELDARGEFSKITTEFLIGGIKRSERGFSLELVNYNEALYDDGPIPKYQSNITQKPPESSAEIPPDYATREDLNSSINGIKNGDTAVGNPDTPENARAEALRDYVGLFCSHSGTGLSNTVQAFEWEVKKGADAEWESAGSGNYYFDRAADGWPEKEDFSGWRFRVRAKSVFEKYSDWAECAVDTDSYGTWKLQKPVIQKKEADRTITLLFSEPPRSDSRTVYGSIEYRVQVMRPDVDSDFFKPDESGNPYGDEFSYKVDGDTGFVPCSGVYIQTMCLKGQNSGELDNTTYMFRVTAANESGNVSEAAVIQATALCTNIRDFVKANETVKKSYISANIGTITQGSFGGTANNLWDLSTFVDDSGKEHYEGKMRIGGADQYLKVTPVMSSHGLPTGEYAIEFKVGNFEVSTTSTKLNGVQTIQNDEDPYNRLFLSPTKFSLQHRNSVADDDGWYDVTKIDPNGFAGKTLFSDGCLSVTNQTIEKRRAEGADIGVPYLSDNFKVYHFDTDENDQNGDSALTISGPREIKVTGGKIGTKYFVPAILNYAPYSEVGGALYGQFSIATNFESPVFTLDFWIQFLYVENQIIFKVGNGYWDISLQIANTEPFYNELNGTDTPYNAESAAPESKAFYKYGLSDELYFADGYNKKESAESPYNTAAKDEYNSNFTYYALKDGTYVQTAVTPYTYDELLAAGLYKFMCVFNTVKEASSFLHVRKDTKSFDLLVTDILGSNLKDGEWYHFAVCRENSVICVYLNSTNTEIPLEDGSANYAVEASFNPTKQSFIIDELCFDGSLKCSFDNFLERTEQKKPFGALDDREKWLVLAAADPDKIKTNIFKSSVFKTAVKQILTDNNLLSE